MDDSSRPATRNSARRSTASAAASTSALPASTDNNAVSQQATSTSKPLLSGAMLASTSTLVPPPPASSDEQLNKDSALAVLMSLEAPSSAQLVEQQGKHWYMPQLCCFDLAGWPSGCSWKAECLCGRCEALYALCQAHSKGRKDGSGRGIAQAILASASSLTQCASSTCRSAKTPELPLELVELILDQVILDARRSGNGRVVCALMHTCVSARTKMMGAVETVVLHRYEFRNTKSMKEATDSWMEPFCTYFEWLLRSFLFDPTSNGGTAPAKPPPFPDSLEPIEGGRVDDPETVELSAYLDGGLVRGTTSWATHHVQGSSLLCARDARPTFEAVLEEIKPALRRFSPYVRARRGLWSAKDARCHVELSATLCGMMDQLKVVNCTLARQWNICELGYQRQIDNRPPPMPDTDSDYEDDEEYY